MTQLTQLTAIGCSKIKDFEKLTHDQITGICKITTIREKCKQYTQYLKDKLKKQDQPETDSTTRNVIIMWGPQASGKGSVFQHVCQDKNDRKVFQLNYDSLVEYFNSNLYDVNNDKNLKSYAYDKYTSIKCQCVNTLTDDLTNYIINDTNIDVYFETMGSHAKNIIYDWTYDINQMVKKNVNITLLYPFVCLDKLVQRAEQRKSATKQFCGTRQQFINNSLECMVNFIHMVMYFKTLKETTNNNFNYKIVSYYNNNDNNNILVPLIKHILNFKKTNDDFYNIDFTLSEPDKIKLKNLNLIYYIDSQNNQHTKHQHTINTKVIKNLEKVTSFYKTFIDKFTNAVPHTNEVLLQHFDALTTKDNKADTEKQFSKWHFQPYIFFFKDYFNDNNTYNSRATVLNSRATVLNELTKFVLQKTPDEFKRNIDFYSNLVSDFFTTELSDFSKIYEKTHTSFINYISDEKPRLPPECNNNGTDTCDELKRLHSTCHSVSGGQKIQKQMNYYVNKHIKGGGKLNTERRVNKFVETLLTNKPRLISELLKHSI